MRRKQNDQHGSADYSTRRIDITGPVSGPVIMGDQNVVGASNAQKGPPVAAHVDGLSRRASIAGIVSAVIGLGSLVVAIAQLQPCSKAREVPEVPEPTPRGSRSHGGETARVVPA